MMMTGKHIVCNILLSLIKLLSDYLCICGKEIVGYYVVLLLSWIGVRIVLLMLCFYGVGLVYVLLRLIEPAALPIWPWCSSGS